MNDTDRISVDELTDEQVEAIVNTRGFRKMLAYQRLAEGVKILNEQDEIYDALVTSITNQHGSVSTESSIEEVLQLFREEVEAYTEPLVDENGDDQGISAEDLQACVEDEERDVQVGHK